MEVDKETDREDGEGKEEMGAERGIEILISDLPLLVLSPLLAPWLWWRPLLLLLLLLLLLTKEALDQEEANELAEVEAVVEGGDEIPREARYME